MMKFKILLIVFLLFLAKISHAITIFGEDSTALVKKKKFNKVHVSGVIQVHYLNEINTNGDSLKDPDGFRILRARLIASGKISKFISYQMMVDPRAPEQGGILRDAYLEFKLSSNQLLRIGQQKTQFGYDNMVSITKGYFVNRAEVSDNLSRGFNLRDIGIGHIGHIKMSQNFRFEHAATYTNGARMNVAGPFEFSNTKNAFGRAGIRYKKEEIVLRAGFSAGMGGMMDYGDDPLSPKDDFYIKFKRAGIDAVAETKWLFMAAEYVWGQDHIGNTYDDRFGYYITLVGKTRWNAGPLFRYDVLDDEFNRPTAGIFYGLPDNKFRLLINYELRGNIKDVPQGHDDRLYIQTQIRF